MKPDDFESQLQRQPLRQMPAGWRSEILRAAETARPVTTVAPPAGWLDNLREQVVAFMWPNPKAWAGLAAVWVAIIALNITSRDPAKSVVVAQQPQTTTRTASMTITERREMLAKMLGQISELPPEPADRPKLMPPRRSDVRPEWAMA